MACRHQQMVSSSGQPGCKWCRILDSAADRVFGLKVTIPRMYPVPPLQKNQGRSQYMVRFSPPQEAGLYSLGDSIPMTCLLCLQKGHDCSVVSGIRVMSGFLKWFCVPLCLCGMWMHSQHGKITEFPWYVILTSFLCIKRYIASHFLGILLSGVLSGH